MPLTLNINFVSCYLLNSLIVSNSFWAESLGFSMYNIISSANNESFTSSFPIQISFISLSYFIAAAKTSKTILKRSGESGHPCLVPDLQERLFAFSYLV